MKISMHGQLRVIDRTKMHPEDVLSVVKSGMVIPLGFNDGYEFLLFYSPYDKSGKIAIVSAERTLLISVWEVDFCLPKGIEKPTMKMIVEAKRLLNIFLFGKLGGNTKIYDPNEMLSVKVQVISGKEVKQEFEIASIPRFKSKELENIISYSCDEFRKIALEMEDSPIPLCDLYYNIIIFDPKTPHVVERLRNIKHTTLVDRFLSIEVTIFVRIQVLFLNEIQYEHKDLPAPRFKSRTLQDAISFLKDDFQSVVLAVSSCDVSLDDVKYKINFLNSKTLLPSKDPQIVKHANFVRFLSA